MLPDTFSKFDNSELNLNIDQAEARMDIFKIDDKFCSNVERIVNELPGKNLEIDVDPIYDEENESKSTESNININSNNIIVNKNVHLEGK